MSQERKTGFFNLSEVIAYLTGRGKFSKKSFNMKAMHFINVTALTIFLIGMIYFIAKKILM